MGGKAKQRLSRVAYPGNCVAFACGDYVGTGLWVAQVCCRCYCREVQILGWNTLQCLSIVYKMKSNDLLRFSNFNPDEFPGLG